MNQPDLSQKVNLLIGITACNRLLYSKALLKSLQVFKDLYEEKISTRIIYVDNGTTEPGAKEFLDNCKTIDEVVYRPERDPSNDEWKGKNEVLARINQALPWSTTPADQVICFLQDDSQLVNPHAFAASVIDFALSNQIHQSVHIIRKVSVEGNTKIAVTGADKELIGMFAAEIRSKRPPEPFKGKGVKYAEEFIVRKEGKKK